MKIKDILALPIGEKITGSFVFTIKTAKKKWQVDSEWFQQVLLMDKTGEMLADVRIVKYIPLIAKQQIIIKASEIQETQIGKVVVKKLLIDEFLRPTMTADEYEAGLDEDIEEFQAVIEGKIRHGIICSMIRAGFDIYQDVDSLPKENINILVKFVMTGK